MFVTMHFLKIKQIMACNNNLRNFSLERFIMATRPKAPYRPQWFFNYISQLKNYCCGRELYTLGNYARVYKYLTTLV